jgi:hypothetical protein
MVTYGSPFSVAKSFSDFLGLGLSRLASEGFFFSKLFFNLSKNFIFISFLITKPNAQYHRAIVLQLLVFRGLSIWLCLGKHDSRAKSNG